jgi:hypothetical protein
MAGKGPMPAPNLENTGIISPNRAMEGSVSTMVARPISGPASQRTRTTRMPSGTEDRQADRDAHQLQVLQGQFKDVGPVRLQVLEDVHGVLLRSGRLA